MKLPLAIAMLMGGLALGTAANAHPGGPGHRHVAVVPVPHVAPAPRIVRPGAAYCATYGCAGSVTTTGPQGNSITRSGNAACADGTCTRSRSITGPYGETATFKRSLSR
ncbi:MAG: hypothetical protein AAGP08_10355 [Pseudomonadota bacterium]